MASSSTPTGLEASPPSGEAAPSDLTLRDVYRARRRIASTIRRTPLVVSDDLSGATGSRIHLKLENTQKTGSFKLRGAANKILGLTAEERLRGIVAVSSGNHGKAVSYVAQSLGAPATVCLTNRVPEDKVTAIRRLGAHVVIAGETQEAAEQRARELEHKHGPTFLHPFDDPAVIAGQGTTGIEILEDLPDVDTVLVPLSGGGLISGIALAMKSAAPAIQVVGVSMDRGPAMHNSLQAGQLVGVLEEDTLADALAGGLGPVNNFTFDMCRRFVDDTVLVSEDEIAAAMAWALQHEHLVVEGGGAVGIAAVLAGKVPLGEQVAIVVSGGNTDLARLLRLTQAVDA